MKELKIAAIDYNEELVYAFKKIRLIDFSYKDIKSYYAMVSLGEESKTEFYFEEEFLNTICFELKMNPSQKKEIELRKGVTKTFMSVDNEELIREVKEEYLGLLEIIFLNKKYGTPRKFLILGKTKIRISEKKGKLAGKYKKINKKIR